MSRVTSDSERIAQLVTWGLLDVTWGLLNIGTAVYFMVLINWQLALIVLTIIPILVVIAAQFKKKILLQFRLVRKINSKITGTYNEQIAGVRVIKALNCEVKILTNLVNSRVGCTTPATAPLGSRRCSFQLSNS